jgi:hypothetical protein
MFWKIQVFVLRLWEYISRWPYRLLQFIAWLFWIHRPKGKFVVLRWIAGLLLKGIDLMPIPLILETLMDVIKWKTRCMTPDEIKIAKSVFGEAVNYALVGMDSASWPVKKGKAMAYVTLHTINFEKSIPDHILVHEMTHIWQYRKHGSLYLTEALFAQRWGGGYDYGGPDALKVNAEKGLMAFNFEQQAEIVEDSFKSTDKSAFEKYVDEIRET